MKVAEVRDLQVDELRQREKDLDDPAVPAANPEVDGAARGGAQAQALRRDLARVKTVLREKETA
jgi:ribosomal protein L29